MEFIISLIVAGVSLTASIIVFFNNRKSATNVYFSLLNFFIGLYPIFNYLSLNATTDTEAFFWSKFILLSSIPVGPLFYFFVNSFPETRFFPNKKLQIALVIWAVINLILVFPGLIFSSVSIIDGQPQIQPGPAMPSFGLLQVFSTVLASYILIKKSTHAKGMLKEQLQYVTFGIVSSIGLTIFSTFILGLIFKNTILIGISPLFLLIGGISISYSIIRHRLLDIRFLIARTISYSLLIFLIAFLFSVYIFLIGELFFNISLTFYQQTVLTILTIILILSFPAFRHVIESLTNRFFFKDRYDANELLRSLSLIMAANIELEKLTHSLLTEILKTMKINHGAFVLTYKTRITSIMHEGYTDVPEFDETDINFLLSMQQAVIFDEVDNQVLKDTMRKYQFRIALYLKTEAETLGIFALGDKLSGDIYSDDDIKLLKILAPEMAVALRNSESYEEIRQFNVTLRQEIEKATAQLQTANKRLEVLDRLKDEFVSLASHELRTPMTAIKSYIWLFLDDKTVQLNDKQRQYIERAYQSTNRLINLVNDMLNVSRIESGRLIINFRPVDLLQVVKDVVTEINPAAKQQGLTITISPPNGPLPLVFGDPDKLKQVLINLIGNAIKFTESGGHITLSFRFDGKYITTLVEDTGRGISREDLPKLFQKFGMVGDKYLISYAAQRTGLGLYITKSITEMHGGRIWVESDGVNKGSRFYFTLKKYSAEEMPLKGEG